MKKLTSLLRTSLLFLLLPCLALAGCGRTDKQDCILVKKGASLQSAIDRAQSGDVLCLEAGSWTENVVIGKPLTIRGSAESPTILEGERQGYPVVMIEILDSEDQGDVVLSNLHVLNAQGEACAEFSLRDQREICPYGVLIIGEANARVESCELASNRTGVAATGSGSLSVLECDIHDNDWEGIYVGGTSTAAVMDSRIHANGTAGVGVAASAAATIQDCVIEQNIGDGVGVADYARAILGNCTISNNGWNGIKLVFAAEATVESCRIEGNALFGVSPLNEICYPDAPDELDFVGRVNGQGNWIPGPGEDGGNSTGALCPTYPGEPWPSDFVSEAPPSAIP